MYIGPCVDDEVTHQWQPLEYTLLHACVHNSTISHLRLVTCVLGLYEYTVFMNCLDVILFNNCMQKYFCFHVAAEAEKEKTSIIFFFPNGVTEKGKRHYIAKIFGPVLSLHCASGVHALLMLMQAVANMPEGMM